MGTLDKGDIATHNLPSSLELKNATASEPQKKRKRATNGALAVPFSQNRCNNDIARMILLHDYSLDIVEHPGFIKFVQNLQPQFETVTSNTIYNECLTIYSMEKTKLSNLLSEIPGTVSLSLNLWTSDETTCYAVLSGQFIDSHWRLNCRLLNVVKVPFPDSDNAFNHAILSCLSVWGIESKLFALTLDSSFANESAILNLRSLLSVKNPHMSNGQFLIGSCYAHILTSLAMDSLNAMNETVQKVRNCVKYVKTSDRNEEKFNDLKLQLQVSSKKNLVIDNCTRWDSTYLMLSAASELKEVFACLDTFDKHTLSSDEWRQIDTLCDYLNCFYKSADIITAQNYPTADKFFEKVCTIQLKLFNSLAHDDQFESNLIKPLIEKFEKYWKDCSFVLAMAVVMNPKYKLQLVGHFFTLLYREQAESFLRTVKDGIYALFLEYIAQSLPLPSFEFEQRHEEAESFLSAGDDTFADVDIYISDISNHTKSELDIYLEEGLCNGQEDFGVLDWWKLNKVRYPMLSKMAADLLSMPLAVIPSESVFNTRRNKVDSFRVPLKEEAIEAFACAKDWLS